MHTGSKYQRSDGGTCLLHSLLDRLIFLYLGDPEIMEETSLVGGDWNHGILRNGL